MIVKELDACSASMDLFAQAGRAAEEQMVHYLRRAFGNDETIRIYNGLRLENDGDAAQVDHLVLHRYGMIIVESKSVTTKVRVNDQGEWARWYGGQWRGMPSPILQAERQAQFIRDYLERHEAMQRGRFATLVGGRGAMPIDIVVAISDTGIIERPQGFADGLVLKADQVTARIAQIIETYREKERKAESFFHLNPLDGPFVFLKGEYPRVTDFLRQHHTPASSHEQARQIHPHAPRIAPSAQAGATGSFPAAAEKTPACRQCRSSQLVAQFGPYGYYFRCRSCGHNTPIKPPCPICGQRTKVRKSGGQLFGDCGSCGRSTLLYTSPAIRL